MQSLSDLREHALERAKYKCEWADCDNTHIRLEMAHLIGIGMGGRNKDTKYDINNVAMLCKQHHDIYDGRIQSLAKKEYRKLLTAYLNLSR